MNIRKVASFALVLLLAVSVPSAAHDPPTAPGALWEWTVAQYTQGLEVHATTLGVDKGTEQFLEFQVRNPGGDDDLAIWEFLVTAPAGSGMTLSAASRINLDGWVVFKHPDCDGPESLQGLPAGPCETVVFRANKGFELRPGGMATFTMQVDVETTVDYCSSIPLTVVGTHLRQDDELRWSHTGLAPFGRTEGSVIPVFVHELSEEPAVVEDWSFFVDFDHNGHIDHVGLQFSKQLDPLTINKADFEVGSTADVITNEFKILGVNVTTPTFAMSGGNHLSSDVDCPVNSMVIVQIEEKSVLDTGNPPEVSYGEGRGDDRYKDRIFSSIAGVPVAEFDDLIPVDLARPVLASALTYIYDDPNDSELNNLVLLTFSEPVRSYGPGCSGAGSALTADDFWLNARSGGAVVMSISGETITHRLDPEEHEPDDRRMWVRSNSGDLSYYNTWDDTEHKFVPHDSAVERSPNENPHRYAPRSSVCDAASNRAWDHLWPGEVLRDPAPGQRPNEYPEISTEQWNLRFEPLSVPSIARVHGDVSHDWLIVEFTGEVHRGACEKNDLRDYFTVVDGRGPQGVVAVEFISGADRLRIKLDGNLTEQDASGDPTYLRFQKDVLFHDLDPRHVCDPAAPDRKDKHRSPAESREPWQLRTQDEPIVDITVPRPLHAWTRDLDGNGKIDAIEWEWSEPVRDVSFRQGNFGSAGVALDVFGHINYRRVDNGVPDDEVVTTSMQSLEDLGYDTHRMPVTKAQRQLVVNEWAGLFMDLSQNPEFPSRASGNWAPNLTSSLANDTWDHFTLMDGAPPRVMRAITLDTNHNGLIDGYKLIFSEPVKDSTFDKAHWSVRDPTTGWTYTITGLYDQKSLDSDSKVRLDPFINDEILILKIQERLVDPEILPHGDTGFPIPPPQLNYDPKAADGGLTDLAELPAELGGPNRMLAMNDGKVVEEDGARPVFLRALGCEGTNRVRAVFSENVAVRRTDDQPLRPLRETDIHYGNGFAGGATGLQNDTFKHQLGRPHLDIDTKSPLASGDFGKDFLQAQPDVRFNETVSVVQENHGELHSRFEKVFITRSRDIFEPERIKVLEDHNVTAGSVDLAWTIPRDPGCTDAGIVDYRVRVQKLDENSTRINPATVETIPPHASNLLSYWWFDTDTERNRTGRPVELLETYDVGEGKRLNVRVLGLEAESEYEITVQPVDRAGNIGPMADPVKIKTKIDLTPPDRPSGFQISSSTGHAPGQVSRNPLPAFRWTPAVDNESIHVSYVVALTRNTGYTPAQSRDLVALEPQIAFNLQDVSIFAPGGRASGLAPPNWFDAPEKWFFVVGACSGGGCTKLGEYNFSVGPKINNTDVANMHNGMETTVRYLEDTGDVRIGWTLPKKVPCLPTATQIWRMGEDETQYTLLGTFREPDATYRDREFRDTSDEASRKARYLVTLGCDDQVFTYYDAQTKRHDSVKALGAGFYPEDRTPSTTTYPGTAGTVETGPFSAPLWVWIILAILGLALLAGLVLFFVGRRNHGEIWQDSSVEEATIAPGEDDDEIPEGAAEKGPVREIGGAYRPPSHIDDTPETHDIKCPSCKEQFRAEGSFPLKVTCPHCGTSGTLR